MYRGCLESASRVSGRWIEGVLLALIGGCLKHVWKVSGRCLKRVWKAKIGPVWPHLALEGIWLCLSVV